MAIDFADSRHGFCTEVSIKNTSMELRQLRYFVTTARTLSFSAAARKLYITQSTLSQQIQALETELDTLLFSRNSHRVALTEAGDRLLPLAIDTLRAADECATQVRDLNETVGGELNIGVTHSFSTLLTQPLADFLHQYRQVRLQIYYADSLRLAQMLREGKIDLALAYKSALATDEFESHVLFHDRLCAIVRHDHLLAGRRSISLAELERDDWGIAMPSQQMQAREMLDSYWEQEGEAPHLRKRIELNDANFILDLIDDSDVLVGILSAETMKHRRGLVAIPLELPNNELLGCIHVLARAYRKRSAQIFVDMLRKRVEGGRV